MQELDQLYSGELLGTRHLKLSCNFTTFPPEILDLADTLESLDLSGNHLSALPDGITTLKHLKRIFLSDNAFTEFPPILGQCTRLDMIGLKANKIGRIQEGALPSGIRWLILTNNRVTQLPKSIGTCTNLQKLMLAGNQLKELPGTMAYCKKLELLRIAANHFEEFPSWLFSLPRLSWLALAGNPVTKPNMRSDQLVEIPWSELEPEERLGEGASGIISRARWCNGKEGQEVAVKVFKGEVTSDGLPSDEMDACITAGAHANLVNVVGRIKEHPQQKPGLVFDLIDPSFTNLGGPPDFETCTRDTFNPGTSFSAQQVLHIALGIASAVAHLHERNMIHGDLYAHNILVDNHATPLLGDFGAAYICDTIKTEHAAALQRIEARAFGCLLDDLLNYIEFQDKHSAIVNPLVQLRHDCMQQAVLLRPDFETIHKRLKNMTGIL